MKDQKKERKSVCFTPSHLKKHYIHQFEHKETVLATAQKAYIDGFISASQYYGFLLEDIRVEDMNRTFVEDIHKRASDHVSKMV